ncbi:MAG TPA: carboxypeptidase regulatory-like domain-containing protein [Bryobacteraceae bacterium]|nr:carboxypeptidase regulatory-like domain-containing protein [Bryobacteraceae bacterium]
MLRPFLLAALIGVNALAQTADVEGIVRDATRQPVVGATVSLKSAAGEPAATALTAKDGSYHFGGLRDGLYTITAKKIGYREASASVTLKLQSTAKLDLALSSEQAPDFFDQPTFTVAGVSDPGQAGGHGSDSILRSTEKLAEATAALSSTPTASVKAEESPERTLEAARALQREAESAPTEPNLFNWGADLLKHRAPLQATQVFTNGHRLFPESVRMLLGLGAGYYALGSFDKAARSFFQAADLNPADPDSYLFLGRVQDMNTTEEQGIVDRLARFARLQPENALANYYYALCLWRQKPDAKTATAVQPLLEKAIRLDPTLGVASLELGIVLAGANDLPDAIASYRKAIKADPDLAQAHYRLGQAYKRAGQAEEARQQFALYSEASKKSAEQAERERAEILEFVFNLGSRDSGSGGRPRTH